MQLFSTHVGKGQTKLSYFAAEMCNINNISVKYIGINVYFVTEMCNIGVNCLFGVLRHFQHCTSDITTGSWKGRGNQYIEFPRVVYCKLPTNGKQLPAFPLEPVRGSNPGLRGGRRVLPLTPWPPI